MIRFVLLAGLLAGCAPAGQWYHDTFSQEQVDAAARYCEFEAKKAGAMHYSALQSAAATVEVRNACMQAQGFHWVAAPM